MYTSDAHQGLQEACLVLVLPRLTADFYTIKTSYFYKNPSRQLIRETAPATWLIPKFSGLLFTKDQINESRRPEASGNGAETLKQHLRVSGVTVAAPRTPEPKRRQPRNTKPHPVTARGLCAHPHSSPVLPRPEALFTSGPQRSGLVATRQTPSSLGEKT